jgi:hypothetical protein
MYEQQREACGDIGADLEKVWMAPSELGVAMMRRAKCRRVHSMRQV